jgi:hypothetical protein
MKLSDIMSHADLSVWSQVSMAIFLGVFLLVIIRVLRTPRETLNQISERAIRDTYDGASPVQGDR